jgi:hypothetical protein
MRRDDVESHAELIPRRAIPVVSPARGIRVERTLVKSVFSRRCGLSRHSAAATYGPSVVVAVGRIWTRLERHPGRSLVVAMLFAMVLRLPFVGWPLGADEGGFLLVARQWDGDGPLLYDGQWVDRPPLLIVVFKLGSVLGGPVGLRLLSLGFAALTIVGAWWAGRLINGARGAVVAALVAAALGSNFLFDGFELVGEGIAGAFVMLSSAATLSATSRQGDRRSLLLALAAGFLAALAVLTKQNYFDAAVFAAAIFGLRLRAMWAACLAWVAGLAIPILGAIGWAAGSGQPGVRPFVDAMFGFRQQAATTIATHLGPHQIQRMNWMLVLFVASGMIWLVCQIIVRCIKFDPSRRLSIALPVMLAYGLFSIVAGMGWWSHYLLELVPVLAMSSALVSASPVKHQRRIWSARVATVGVLASALVTTGIGAVGASAAQGGGGHDVAVSEWLREASHPSDTVVLAFGAPNVIEMSGLATPYRYSWSLQVHLMDPHLDALIDVLNGPRAPTWLVRIASPLEMSGLDNPRFKSARSAHYRLVETVCGHPIYLHRGLVRLIPPKPDCPAGLGW